MRVNLIALLCLLAVVSTARADASLRVGIADDAALQYGGEAVARQAVAEWQRLGVDESRVQVRWSVAAAPTAGRTKPAGFDARDPGDPGYDWRYVDQAVTLLRAAGIAPVLQITGSGPLWASSEPQRANPRYRPIPARFADFVHAVVARYGADTDRYILWNEPNQPLWLQPQYTCRTGHGCAPAAPDLYRDLFRAGAAEIRSADPSAEILMGALAPLGQDARKANSVMRPLAFLRRLGCVDAGYHRVRTGACATARPVRATAFAYHPHPVFKRPDQPSPNPDDAAIGDLPRLETALDRVTRAGVIGPASGRRFAIDLTELGYQTNPPDRFSGVSPAHQAAWLQWAAYEAASDPRVRSIMQYEWRDEPLSAGTGGWQSGLRYVDGRAKPLLSVFPNPFFVDVRPGLRLATFWGQVRPGGAATVRIRRGTALVRTVQTNAAGLFRVRLPVTERATYHYDYDAPGPGGATEVASSGTQTVAPRRR